MAFFWISSILLVFVKNALSEYNSEVCTLETENCGLVPPPLPTNFEMKGEIVDHHRNSTFYHEMYFDYTNFRGKYMYLQRGIERHFLYDYDTSQILEWYIIHPGVDIKRDPLSQACFATAIEDSEYRGLFGYLDDYTKRPKMFNSNEALRFGGKYMFIHNGSDVMKTRGLPVNNFIGCLYDFSLDATFRANFSFSASNVATSGGTGQAVVTGVENGLLSVPVKIQLLGAMPGEEGFPVIFNRTDSISWFVGEPEFSLDTFQIPPWMYCDGYRSDKAMPKFPTAFYTRVMKTTLSVDTLGSFNGIAEQASYEEIYYYQEKRLARRDYTPDPDMDSEIKFQFQSLSPISTVYDFNSGLLYVTNKPTGRCYIRPIAAGDFFETSQESLYLKLGDPEEIFLMQTDKMEYKGTAFTRDIDCEVWTGKYYDKTYNATYIKETYISTNGWHEQADELLEYGVPVKHVIINQELEGEAMEGVTTYNFLKFMNKPPNLQNFDVSNCIETVEHKHFAILLAIPTQTRDLLFSYRWQFLETAQYYLADLTQVMSPLRIQRLRVGRISPSDSRTFLEFTLVGKANLRTNVVVPQRGASLTEAIEFMQKFVDNGRFAINFYPPGGKEPTLVPARPGSLYHIKPTGDLQGMPFSGQDIWAEMQEEPAEEEMTPIIQQADEAPEVIEHPGMSKTALALLAVSMLIIGVAIGIATMYLYIRFYSERHVEDHIRLEDSGRHGAPSEMTAEHPQ